MYYWLDKERLKEGKEGLLTDFPDNEFHKDIVWGKKECWKWEVRECMNWTSWELSDLDRCCLEVF